MLLLLLGERHRVAVVESSSDVFGHRLPHVGVFVLRAAGGVRLIEAVNAVVADATDASAAESRVDGVLLGLGDGGRLQQVD